MSTVTDPRPGVIAWNPLRLPGKTSVIDSVGVQTPGAGGGVGLGVGPGVGLGEGVGVGFGTGNEHFARISTAFDLAEALKVKSTGCPGFGRAKTILTGSNVPNGKAGILTTAFIELTTDTFCKPIPEFAGSIVTRFSVPTIEENAAALPGNTSVTVIVGVQIAGSITV